MLRITVTNGSRPTLFKLEGRLAGPWVDELERAWNDSVKEPESQPIRVDLSGVTFVDLEGKKLLGRMFQQGAELYAGNILTKYILEEVRSERNGSY